MDSQVRDSFETNHGLRFTWNNFPVGFHADDFAASPLAALYTPFKTIDNLGQVHYRPVLCSMCSGILNPYCKINYITQSWICCLCNETNKQRSQYANITPNNQCPELMEQFCTMEYITKNTQTRASVLIFVIDTVMIEEEFTALIKTLGQIILSLPSNTEIAVITYNTNVFLHEIGQDTCARSLSFRGTAAVTPDQVNSAICSSDIAHLLAPLETCEVEVMKLLESLQCTVETNNTADRPQRCTGVALGVATHFANQIAAGVSARIITCIGGPCTIGPGKIAEESYVMPLRTVVDIQKNEAPLYPAAKAYYTQLGEVALLGGHVVDLFTCCLDQTGLAEQSGIVKLSGGCMILDDSFTRGVFIGSLRKLLSVEEDGQQFATNAELVLLCSQPIEVAGAYGHLVPKPGANATPTYTKVSKDNLGVGASTQYSLGGLDPTATLAIIFKIAEAQVNKQNLTGYLQFRQNYIHANGNHITRVSTVMRPLHLLSGPPNTQGGFIQSFDQECMVALLTRKAIHATLTQPPIEALRQLDKSLITICSRFGTVTNATKLDLPYNFSLLPQFVFHLRRSQLLKWFNNSLDEITFFHFISTRQSVEETLLVVQPSLISYSINQAPMPAPLDVSACAADKILFLDTYFHIVVWYGTTIVTWKNQNVQNLPEYQNFNEMLKAPLEKARQIIAARIPTPRFIECVEKGSQSRFLMAKLNPSISHNNNQEQGVEPPIFSDDVTLFQFIVELCHMISKQKK